MDIVIENWPIILIATIILFLLLRIIILIFSHSVPRSCREPLALKLHNKSTFQTIKVSNNGRGVGNFNANSHDMALQNDVANVEGPDDNDSFNIEFYSEK